jgi:hypothetical protein
MLLNERYRGAVTWNKTQWLKDPDSGKRLRRDRPRSEWIERIDETARIVSDAQWSAALAARRPMPGAARAWTGGQPKYLLSGLLRCDRCGAHYIMGNSTEYQCSAHRDGRACENGIRVRREHAQLEILTPIVDELFTPERVRRVVVPEMHSYHAARLQERLEQSTRAPKALKELNARIDRLRERLERGDPDMTADEISATIQRAEAKRSELAQSLPEERLNIRRLERLPAFVEAFRRQVKKALDGKADPRTVAQVRVILRDLFTGEIRLQPQPGGGLKALWNLQLGALLLRASGTCGSGGRI